MILLTVFAVSIDAYAAGLAYGSGGRADGWIPLYISAFSFVLPAAAMLAVSALTVASDWLNAASACIIIILGVRGVASPPREKRMRMQMKRGGGWAENGLWTPKKDFFDRKGLQAAIDYIKAKNMIPGLWFEFEATCSAAAENAACGSKPRLRLIIS